MKLHPGRCFVCGCTDRCGCPSGCWWADRAHVLCSRCAHAMALVALALVKGVDNAHRYCVERFPEGMADRP